MLMRVLRNKRHEPIRYDYMRPLPQPLQRMLDRKQRVRNSVL